MSDAALARLARYAAKGQCRIFYFCFERTQLSDSRRGIHFPAMKLRIIFKEE